MASNINYELKTKGLHFIYPHSPTLLLALGSPDAPSSAEIAQLELTHIIRVQHEVPCNSSLTLTSTRGAICRKREEQGEVDTLTLTLPPAPLSNCSEVANYCDKRTVSQLTPRQLSASRNFLDLALIHQKSDDSNHGGATASTQRAKVLIVGPAWRSVREENDSRIDPKCPIDAGEEFNPFAPGPTYTGVPAARVHTVPHLPPTFAEILRSSQPSAAYGMASHLDKLDTDKYIAADPSGVHDVGTSTPFAFSPLSPVFVPSRKSDQWSTIDHHSVSVDIVAIVSYYSSYMKGRRIGELLGRTETTMQATGRWNGSRPVGGSRTMKRADLPSGAGSSPQGLSEGMDLLGRSVSSQAQLPHISTSLSMTLEELGPVKQATVGAKTPKYLQRRPPPLVSSTSSNSTFFSSTSSTQLTSSPATSPETSPVLNKQGVMKVSSSVTNKQFWTTRLDADRIARFGNYAGQRCSMVVPRRSYADVARR